ncbi:MAG TPA: tetratricopeptide repeat protein [Longimicrobiales bacterium]|nr:tetratricopeptide repeat protein [Longimicrobiales bacterium]
MRTIAYRSGLALTAATVASLLAQPACATQDAGGQTSSRADPYAAYLAGEYDDAARGLRALIEADPLDTRARRTLVAVFVETGQYEEAERAARSSETRELANALGEVLMRTGKLEEAESSFRRAVQAGASDANTARLNLATLDWNRGERDAALNAFDRFIDIYNDSPDLSARDLIAVAEAVRRLGARNPQLFQDAVKALDEAMAADRGIVDGAPDGFEARVRMGHLFLEKYNSIEAQPLFREVLAQNPHHPGALLGMAKAKNFDGSSESLELVDQSLETNPNSVDALVFRARLRLDLEENEGAREDIDRALSINPLSLDALTTRATAEWLEADVAAYERTRAEVMAIDPAHSSLFNEMAELAVRQRRYEGAVELAREAVALNPLDGAAWGTLGLNELRIGAVDAARANLEMSFERDPYNPWIKNTLDLLDTFGEYRIVRTERFELMLHQSEADLLAPYVGELAEEAYTALAERYQYSPPTPVRVEVYPRHADFSVRTVGLAGLGALGVCFGNVLAIDSPAAREPGEFNWGSTLWHELAHTMTLGLSNHRVPRWLTEGLSVLEERRARPGWGDDLTPQFLAAYKAGDVFPVSRLSQGFVRPRFPEQIGYSYYQSSLVAEMIEEERGFDTILDMLRAYGRGLSDAEVFEQVLGVLPEAFDDRFDDWLKRRYETQLASVPAARREEGGMIERALGAMRGGGGGGFPAAMARGRELAEEGNLEEAIEAFERAQSMFPEYAGPGSPYDELAKLHQERGDTAAAAAQLQALTAIDENRYGANIALADLLEGMGDAGQAVAALERVIYVSPYEKALHERMVRLYTQMDDRQGVVSARRALVALDPVDRSDALYQLALAYEAAGEPAAARREVVRALEIAPNFVGAQELLLRLRGRSPSGAPE